MTRFFVLYTVDPPTEDPMGITTNKAAAELTSAWTGWVKQSWAHQVDLGVPLRGVQTITADGVQGLRTSISGYTILEAEGAEEAVEILREHPHLKTPGAGIQFFEGAPAERAENDEPLLIGALAAATGASPRSLRHYEQAGLIASIRLTNGYRTYDPGVTERVHRIRRLLRAGFALEAISVLLPILERDNVSIDMCTVGSELVDRALAEIESQVDALEARRKAIQQLTSPQPQAQPSSPRRSQARPAGLPTPATARSGPPAMDSNGPARPDHDRDRAACARADWSR